VYAGDDPVNLVDSIGELSGPGGVAVILGFIAAVCAFLAFFSTGTIVGIPVAIFFGACAVIFGLGAAYEGLVAYFTGG